MFCLRCGSQNADTADNCANCGEPIRNQQGGQEQLYAPPQHTPPQNLHQQQPGYGNSQEYSQQGYGSSYGAQPPNVPNYLVWAILSTLFFCPPTGIVALVYATQVDGKLRSGDYQAAVQASNNARTWTFVSVGLLAAVIAIYLVLVVIAVVLG